MNGQMMAAEISEQPDVLARLVIRRHTIVDAIRDRVSSPAGTIFVARGSSRQASAFGCHVLSAATHRPSHLSLLASETGTCDDLDLAGWLSVGVSQSGRTPEIIETLARHRRQGAQTMAVTNDPDSPLAREAQLHMPLDAGPEMAVPATKTVTGQFATMMILGSAFDESFNYPESTWLRFVESVGACIDDRSGVEAVGRSLDSSTRAVFSGRGVGEPVAGEGALKVKEITGISAEAYDHLELLHGPIAVAAPDVPAVVVDLQGATTRATERVLDELTSRGAPVFVVGDTARADVVIPDGLPEPLAAIVVVVRLQQIALELALIRSIDADHPRSLTKITMT